MQGAQNNDICQVLRDWYERVPALANLVMYTLICGYLLSWTSFGLYLSNIPTDVLDYEVWRLLSASFYCSDFPGLLFTLLMYMPTACDTERGMGSIKYLVYFLCNCEAHTGVMLQALYVGAALLLKMGEIANILSLPAAGLWGVIMLEIVVRCNRDPEAAVA